MYARFVMFDVGPGMRPQINQLADQFAAVHTGMQGFRDQTYLADEEVGRYVGLIVWETEEDAEQAWEELGPRFQEATKDILKAPPLVQLFEVYEPQT
ncbi:MAG: hypothetical protein M3Q60_15420 [Actinomycetota bacterium]|nr:hypothetical protein [Actinomycetota bacterium]